MTELVYILWEKGGYRPDPSTISRIVEIVNSSPGHGAGSFHSTEYEDGAWTASWNAAGSESLESALVDGKEDSCPASDKFDSTTELAPLAGPVESDSNLICPALLARQSMLEAQNAYDALPDDADPGILQNAETACQASEDLLCQAQARSIPGLRAQIEELMNRCMLDEHETQAEATRMLFDNILTGLDGFYVPRDNARQADKMA